MARSLCVDSQSVLGRIGSDRVVLVRRRLWGYGKHIFNCKIQPPNEAHKGHTLSGGWRSTVVVFCPHFITVQLGTIVVVSWITTEGLWE